MAAIAIAATATQKASQPASQLHSIYIDFNCAFSTQNDAPLLCYVRPCLCVCFFVRVCSGHSTKYVTHIVTDKVHSTYSLPKMNAFRQYRLSIYIYIYTMVERWRATETKTEKERIIMKWARSSNNKNHSLVSTQQPYCIYIYIILKRIYTVRIKITCLEQWNLSIGRSKCRFGGREHSRFLECTKLKFGKRIAFFSPNFPPHKT